jgi:hypothetical protein
MPITQRSQHPADPPAEPDPTRRPPIKPPPGIDPRRPPVVPPPDESPNPPIDDPPFEQPPQDPPRPHPEPPPAYAGRDAAGLCRPRRRQIAHRVQAGTDFVGVHRGVSRF